VTRSRAGLLCLPAVLGFGYWLLSRRMAPVVAVEYRTDLAMVDGEGSCGWPAGFALAQYPLDISGEEHDDVPASAARTSQRRAYRPPTLGGGAPAATTGDPAFGKRAEDAFSAASKRRMVGTIEFGSKRGRLSQARSAGIRASCGIAVSYGDLCPSSAVAGVGLIEPRYF
jgi:hypothetical protein